ncbi:MAG TPA: DUF885 domain-containing protein [Candidatus Acidoferrum sp.]|nr:DUF885 domain-containing protein [Candidatus Acidoferrum sp.]
MFRSHTLLSAALCFLLLGPAASAQQPTQPSPASWSALSDDFINQYFAFSPSAATQAGIHTHDTELESYSPAAIAKQVAWLRQFEKRVLSFDPKSLSSIDAADREILLNSIRASLLDLQSVHTFTTNPDTYSSGAANSIFVVMSRKFAPADDRLRSVIAREKQFPRFFSEARVNVKNPPRIYTEIALQQLPGTIDFFEKDVPSAFADAADPVVKTAFAESNAAAIKLLHEYQDWLKSNLLPRSHGDFRLGAAVFSKKLAYEEMVTTPLDALLEVGLADLHKNQSEFQRIAKEVDPAKSPADVLAELESLHPAPDQLMQSFRDTFDGLIAFINAHHIVTLPGDRRPTMIATPPFERATTTAAMDTPGPFEKVATEAYFYVTLPLPTDSPEDVAGMMAAFNIGTISSTSIHEAFPGHFTQYLYEKDAPTKLRRVLSSNTNVEGWAHYTERMMLDEGYAQPGVGAKDLRESRLIRLGELQDALLRDARFVAGIRMHTGKFTLDQARDFFVKEGYQSPKIADVETKRGTSDPTYLYYTLGKLQITKLREDLRKKQGAAFSLQKFHDDFLLQGYPPIAIVRRALLGDSTPTL